jgi:indole-3-glycerol phosphate synthase
VETARDRRPVAALERIVGAGEDDRAGRFVAALSRRGQVNVIAECKRRSPSRGVLRRDYDPVALGRAYEDAGAAAISVLTEPTFFDGDLRHLEQLASTVTRPLLRKDFIVDPYQVLEARAAGASAVLLIVAALDTASLRGLIGEAAARGLAALVEVHTLADLERACAAGARVIGVNSRNLRTLDVDPDTPWRLIDAIPDTAVAVAESGLKTASDLARLREAGFDAFLVGERLVTATDPGAALREITARVPGPDVDRTRT